MGFRAQLIAKTRNMLIDGASIDFKGRIVTPYLFQQLVTREGLAIGLDQNFQKYPPHTYGGNKRHRYADVEAVRVSHGYPSGLEVLLKEAWDRYQLPIAVTEVHLHCTREEQLRWFKEKYETCCSLVKEGIPIRAVQPGHSLEHLDGTGF